MGLSTSLQLLLQYCHTGICVLRHRLHCLFLVLQLVCADTGTVLVVLQDDIEQIMEAFRAFKKNVPVMGGILLDQDMQRVLLVKGWKNSACWGFPRGKIHKNETDAQCAVREVGKSTHPPSCVCAGQAVQGLQIPQQLACIHNAIWVVQL